MTRVTFDREDHWIVASMILKKHGQIKVHGLVYTTNNEETDVVISLKKKPFLPAYCSYSTLP